MLSYRKCVAVLLLKDSKIFVGRRIDMENAWQLPQGGVEKNENHLEAAKRELFEETNVSTVEFLSVSSSYRYDFPPHVQQAILRRRNRLRYAGQEITFFAFRFIGEEKEINICKENREFVEWKWMSTEELLQKIVYFKKPSYRQALAKFKNQGLI
ncbi:MAG: RNA pyrophosphohydrolase [Holosporaceae bacterium]|nr:RNA pyrophosphohydrolase [Holosporaceae bacterium]